MTILFEKVSYVQWLEDFNGYLYPGLVDEWKPREYYDTLKPPQRATEDSAGYDLHSPIDFTLRPSEDIFFPLGFKIRLPSNYFLDIRPRSGQGSKFFLRLANTTGVIDPGHYGNPDNEGTIYVKLRNESLNLGKTLEVERGQAIAQGLILKYHITDNDSPKEKSRLGGGFGSTDKTK